MSFTHTERVSNPHFSKVTVLFFFYKHQRNINWVLFKNSLRIYLRSGLKVLRTLDPKKKKKKNEDTTLNVCAVATNGSKIVPGKIYF